MDSGTIEHVLPFLSNVKKILGLQRLQRCLFPQYQSIYLLISRSSLFAPSFLQNYELSLVSFCETIIELAKFLGTW